MDASHSQRTHSTEDGEGNDGTQEAAGQEPAEGAQGPHDATQQGWGRFTRALGRLK